MSVFEIVSLLLAAGGAALLALLIFVTIDCWRMDRTLKRETLAGLRAEHAAVEKCRSKGMHWAKDRETGYYKPVIYGPKGKPTRKELKYWSDRLRAAGIED